MAQIHYHEPSSGQYQQPAPAGDYVQSVPTIPHEYAPPAQTWSTQPPEWRMIVTTTHSLEGMRITRYLGVVAAEVVLGTSLTKDISAQVKGFVGGRSEAYEREIRHARQEATKDMVAIAEQMQAHAIVGTSFDYDSVNGLVMVTVTGTAVQVSTV